MHLPTTHPDESGGTGGRGVGPDAVLRGEVPRRSGGRNEPQRDPEGTRPRGWATGGRFRPGEGVALHGVGSVFASGHGFAGAASVHQEGLEGFALEEGVADGAGLVFEFAAEAGAAFALLAGELAFHAALVGTVAQGNALHQYFRVRP